MPEYEILSRPAPATGQYEIISKPKPTELDADGNPRVPVEGDVPAPQAERRMPGTQYGQLINEALGNVREGAGRVIAPNVSAWERTKGAGQASLGAAGYVGAPAEYAARKVVGDPVEAVVRLIAGDTAGKMAGDTASGVAGLVGGAAAPKLVREVPGMIREGGKLIGQAADAAGPVMRSTVDAVEDLVKTRMANSERKAADKLANVAPTKDSLYGDAEASYARVKGPVDPDAFRTTVSGLKDALKASDVDMVNHPDNYEQTGKMLKAIERVAGSAEEGEGSAASDGVTSLTDLIKLERSLRPYVRKAKAAGVREGDNTDFRAANILKKQIENFRLGQGDVANAELAKGNELYKRGSKVEDVEDIISKAKRTNDPDYLQREFKDIALDDYAYKNYTPAEQKIIDQIMSNSTLDNIGTGPIGGPLTGKFSKAAKLASLYDRRMKLAEQLKDMIARGGEAQKAAAAEKAAQPSFMDRFNSTFRPGPPNSSNRKFP